MARTRTTYRCNECGATAPAWTGRCSRCGAWDTMDVDRPEAETRSGTPSGVALLSEFVAGDCVPMPTAIDEVDQVLGGGLVPGSVTLLSGEPGIGKSTLTLQIAASVARTGARVVLVTGEESPVQVAARARRLGDLPPSLVVLDSTCCEDVEAAMNAERPQLVVVDSIQTLRCDGSDAAPGSVSQVRDCATRLTERAKSENVSVLMIGHVTKEGSLAGPRLLEHVVDTVLSFSGDRSGDLRLLRADKHRFGPTQTVGVFEMAHNGLQAVGDPSERFLRDRVPIAGSVVTPMIEGHRPVLVELQALVSPRTDQGASQVTQGLAASRCRLVAAVLQQRAGLRLTGVELFVSLVGGLRSDDPGVDLAVAVAVWSAMENQEIPSDLVICGEVGLGGEVRSVAQAPARLAEAQRLGFRRALAPVSVESEPTGLKVIRCATLGDALNQVQPFRAVR